MNKLKEFREKLGLSQADVCRQSGVNLGSYCAYEQGVKSIDRAGFSTVIKIADVLECRVTEILTDEELIKKCKAVKL